MAISVSVPHEGGSLSDIRYHSILVRLLIIVYEYSTVDYDLPIVSVFVVVSFGDVAFSEYFKEKSERA